MENVHWEFHGNHEYSILQAMDGAKLADEIIYLQFVLSIMKKWDMPLHFHIKIFQLPGRL